MEFHIWNWEYIISLLSNLLRVYQLVKGTPAIVKDGSACRGSFLVYLTLKLSLRSLASEYSSVTKIEIELLAHLAS